MISASFTYDGGHFSDRYLFYRVTVLSNFSPLMVAKPYAARSRSTYDLGEFC